MGNVLHHLTLANHFSRKELNHHLDKGGIRTEHLFLYLVFLCVLLLFFKFIVFFLKLKGLKWREGSLMEKEEVEG